MINGWRFPYPYRLLVLEYTINGWRFSLFSYPYRLLVCRNVKPKPTTVTHTWLAVNAQDTFFRITSTGAAKQSLLVALTLGLPTHTAGFTISKWHTYNQTRNKFGQTDRQTYIHTQCYSWVGVAFRRHCHGHASPSSTKILIAILTYLL